MSFPAVFEDLQKAREYLVNVYGESAGVQFDNLVQQGAIISKAQQAAQQSVHSDVCHSCGTTYVSRALYCHHCGTRR